MRFTETSTGQIEKSASTDETRYAIQNVYFNPERGHLVATNGHIMTMAFVTADEGDTEGWITPESLIAYRQVVAKLPQYLRSNPAAIKFQATATQLIITDFEGNQRIFKRPAYTGNFPNYAAVMPKTPGAAPSFTLDFNLLKRVVESLGYAETLTGRSAMIAVFPSERGESACLVKTSQDGPIGIIMPIRAPDETGGWLTTIEQVDGRYNGIRDSDKKREEAKEKKEAEIIASRTDEDEEDEDEEDVEDESDVNEEDDEIDKATEEEADRIANLPVEDRPLPIDRTQIMDLPLTDEEAIAAADQAADEPAEPFREGIRIVA